MCSSPHNMAMFDQLLDDLAVTVSKRPKGIRKGQAWFNRLYELRPDLADSIRGGPLDPFYDDKLLKNAWAWLMEKAENEPRSND